MMLFVEDSAHGRGRFNYCQFRTFLASMLFKFRSWNHGVLFIFGLLISNCHLSICDKCHFPSQWAGRWFQKGVQDPIRIFNGTISNKGDCRESNGDKFLIESRTGDHCYRCVVINEKHVNVLQYKETYCDQHAQGAEHPSLESLCQQINGDAPLFSMFRLDTVPVQCPFIGPFTFSYSREHGECAVPISTIESCTDNSHLLFRFQACANVHGSESRVEELECLAEWKEGSLRYLVGRLNHRVAKTEEDKFRCFVFEKNNSTTYLVAQSGDATCDGLLSATEGSRTMKLTKVTNTRANCKFPTWITGQIWKTLGENMTYDFGPVNGSSFQILNDTKRELTMKVVCARYDHSTESYTQLIAHATEGCQNGYICVRIHKRAPHVVEMQRGKFFGHESEACNAHNFDARTAEFVTLTTTSPESGECPLEGIYAVQMASPRMSSQTTVQPICSEQSTLAAKCSEKFRMEFQVQCYLHEQIKSFQCHGSWEENGTYYLIATAEKTDKRFCIAFSENEKVLHFSGSPEACLRNVHLGREGIIAFNMTSKGLCNDNDGASTVHITFSVIGVAVLLALMVFTCSR